MKRIFLTVLDVLQRKEKQVPTENLLGLIMWQNSEKPLTGHRMKVSMYLMKYMKITKNLLRRVQKKKQSGMLFLKNTVLNILK